MNYDNFFLGSDSPRENLNNFINNCRNKLTVFDENLNWELPVWHKIAVFAKLGVSTRKPKPHELMEAIFMPFAKAYLRYQQGIKPTGTRNELKALRAIEASLMQITKTADIQDLTIRVLDEAVVLAKKNYSPHVAYHTGRELERLAKFVSTHNLVDSSLSNWKNPIKRPSDTVKTGRKAKENREKKLPNDEALQALAEIFSTNPTDQKDIFTTSIMALLMSAPSRISEVLALPADCEVYETDNEGIERYGLRFYSAKGYGGDIKWIPTEMVEVAKKAIARVKNITNETRQTLKQFEENSNRFYRHAQCPSVDDNEPLTTQQAVEALGYNTSYLIRKGFINEDGFYTLDSLWKHLEKNLPDDFPLYDKEKKIRYSNALFILRKNQLHKTRSTLIFEFQKPNANIFNNDLQERTGVKNHQSIFDRHGYYAKNGDKLKITSHQARHLLNTIAQRGGLSNLEIAKWSGRANVKQNRVYDHMSEYELLDLSTQADVSQSLVGLSEISKNIPVTTQEFNTLERGAVHVTEFGYCVHDNTISPCEKFRDCLNCTEQVCVKGETDKLERLKDVLEKTEYVFKRTTSELEQGDFGADRWFTLQEKTIDRLQELIGILESPEIEEGAFIKLQGSDFSQLKRVMKKKLPDNTITQKESKMLDDINNLLGGGLG